MAQTVKTPPAVQETQVRSLGQEDPLEKEMATHSSTLARKIPWTEQPGGLQSMGLQRTGHDWAINTQTLTKWSKSCTRLASFLHNLSLSTVFASLWPMFFDFFSLPDNQCTVSKILSSTYSVNIFMFSVTLPNRFYFPPQSLCKLELIASLPDTLGSPSYWLTVENKVRNVWLVMAECESLPVYTVAKAFRVLI